MLLKLIWLFWRSGIQFNLSGKLKIYEAVFHSTSEKSDQVSEHLLFGNHLAATPEQPISFFSHSAKYNIRIKKSFLTVLQNIFQSSPILFVTSSITKRYSAPSHTSKMEFLHPLFFFAKSLVSDIWLVSKYASALFWEKLGRNFYTLICNASKCMRYFVRFGSSFVQFSKREKHPWEVLLLVKLQASACRYTDHKKAVLLLLFGLTTDLSILGLNYFC